MRTTALYIAALSAALSGCTITTAPPEAASSAPPPVVPEAPPVTTATTPPAAPTPTPTTTQAPAPPPAASSPTPTPPATSAPTPTTPASSQPPSQAAGDAALLGVWKSASCGPRKYERVLTFAKDSAFTAEDRVSPCPPKAVCVWSGIISRKGTFKRSGNTIALSTSDSGKGPGAQPFPASLTVGPNGAPAENAGGAVCTYQR